MPNKNLDEITDVLLLISRLQSLCEGFDETNKTAVFTTKIKILIEISKANEISPAELKYKVGLAKSNITTACNKLVEEGLVEKNKNLLDEREVYYQLTEKGRVFLNDFLNISKKNFEGQLAYKNNMNDIANQVRNLLDLVK